MAAAVTDLAILGFGIDPTPAEQGGKKVQNVLDGIERRAMALIETARKLQAVLDMGRKLASAGGTSRTETEARRLLQTLRQVERQAEQSARSTGNSFRTQFDSALDRMRAKASSTFAAIKSSASGLFSGLGGGGGGGGGGILGTVLGVAGGGIIGGAITSVLGGVAGKLKDVVDVGIDFNATLESAQISLKRLLGSSPAAFAEIEKIKKEALTAPVNFETLLELDQRLISVGFNAQTTAKDLTAFSQGVGLIAGTKGLNERVERIVTQLTQMATKGRAANEELTILAENNIPVYKILADATGKTTDEIFRLAETGQFKGLETAQLLLKQIGAAAKDAGPELQKTYAVLSSNLGDLTQQTAGAATLNIFGSVKKGLEGLTGPGAQGVAASVAAGVNDITKPFTDGFNKLVEGLQAGNFFAVSKEVGANITEGIKAGIVDRSDALDKAVYERAVNVLKVVKGALGINSPSERMRELGRFSGEGYKLGLLDKADEIRATLAQIVDVDAVIAGVKEQLGGRQRSISGKQEANLRTVLDTILKDATLNTKEINVALKQVAYLLATIKHETANTFAAIKERRADPNRQPGLYTQQSKYFDTGFYGRGFVQLTHADNYRRLGQRIGLGNALVNDPNLALRTDIAAQVALVGSQEGLFRRDKQGRRYTLDRFLNEDRTDFFSARNIINGGNDRAGKIAGEASTFFSILNSSVRQPGAAGDTAAQLTRTLRDAEPVITQIRAQAELIPLSFAQINAELNPMPSALARVASETVKVTVATNTAAEQAASFRAIWRDPLEGDIKKVRDEIAQIGQNLDSKAQLEQLKAIRDLKQAEEDAILSQIRNRALLADKTIFHAHRSKARVLDFLQEETKGLTEIVGDAQINTMRTLFDGIDQGVDKLTGRLGAAGSAVNQLIKDLARLGAVKLFEKVFGIKAGGQQAAFAGVPQPSAFNPLSLLTGGQAATGSNGLPSFATPQFNPNGGAAQGGGFNIGGFNIGRNILSRIPGLGRFFAPSVANSGIGNVGATGTGVFANAPVGASSAGPGAAGSFGGLAGIGAGGLLASGGILGSFLGKGPIGKLIGGVGGSLALGAAGAAGLFGGGIAAALPAFLSNPFTAIVAAGLLGGLAISRLLGGGEFKKFSDEVQRAYAIKVKGDKEGKGLYEQSKQIGEQAFGKGQFGKRLAEAVRLEPIKQLIANYGESTNQSQSELVKRTIAAREIADPNNPANRLTRRALGGTLLGGQASIVGENRAEVFMPGSTGFVFPSLQAFYRQALAEIQQQATGGFLGGARRQMAAYLGNRVEQTSSSDTQRVRQERDALRQELRGSRIVMAELTEAISNLRGIPKDQLVEQAISDRPQMITRNLAAGFAADGNSVRETLTSLGF